MKPPSLPSCRRHFLRSSAAWAAGLTAVRWAELRAEEKIPYALRGRLYKSLKIGMVKAPSPDATLADRFRLAKQAGFAGMELNAPGNDVAEVRKAMSDSGLPVDGTVCGTHWTVRHTDADPAVRAQALADLRGALRETHEIGGSTVLLVAGKGGDGPADEVWRRAVENISLALPLAAELGVTIAIENVWNQFCYDHEGGPDQKADQFVRFVDAFASPWVGMQFDIGNHWKYGAVGDWIRALGKRIVKLDVKGFSRATGKFTPIGEGDIDWLDVRKALTEINFYGYCAAEVAGGDLEKLRVVAGEMDQVFGLI